ncbi:MAG: DUF4434 domain-containing protein [bacterium]|nr:DUF4434 domain-containing protein [Candidatus Sumerlaeota bacterium]
MNRCECWHWVLLVLLTGVHAAGASSESVVLKNASLRCAIDPARGGRAFDLSLIDGKNLAHKDYGFFSDHPNVDNWDTFRNLRYTVTGRPTSQSVELRVQAEGIELSKKIRLHPEDAKITLDYEIRNMSTAPLSLNSAFASFLPVPSTKETTPVACWPLPRRENPDTILESCLDAYARCGAAETSGLCAYHPQAGVLIRMIPDRRNLDECRIGVAALSYAGLESHYKFAGLEPGQRMVISVEYLFEPAIFPPDVLRPFYRRWVERIASFRELLKHPPAPPYPGRRLPISGAFYSFWEVGPQLSANKQLAFKEMKAMSDAGMNLVIIETGAIKGVIYKSCHRPTIAGCERTLDHLIEAADKLGMKVFLSLPMINADPFYSNDREFAAFKQNMRLLAGELYQKYGKAACMAGWYIPFEIADSTITHSTERVKIAQAHRELADYLRGLTPHLPVSIAPYFLANLMPDDFKTVWADFLSSAGVDIMMVQDSVGALNVSRDSEERFKILPLYLDALHDACAQTSVALWLDLEVFEQIHGTPIDGEEWSGRPAEIGRVTRQLELGSQYVERIVCYCFSHYLSPNGIIPSAARRSSALYQQYLYHLRRETRSPNQQDPQ